MKNFCMVHNGRNIVKKSDQKMSTSTFPKMNAGVLKTPSSDFNFKWKYIPSPFIRNFLKNF